MLDLKLLLFLILVIIWWIGRLYLLVNLKLCLLWLGIVIIVFLL